MEKPCLVKLPQQGCSGPDDFSFLRKPLAVREGVKVLKILNEVLAVGNLERKKIGPVKGIKNGAVDGPDWLNSRDVAGPHLFRQGQFLERSRPKKIKVPCEFPEETAMGVTADHNSRFAIDGDGRMGCSPCQVFCPLPVPANEGFDIFNSLPKKQLFVFFPDQKRSLSMSQQGIKRWKNNIPDHFRFKVIETGMLCQSSVGIQVRESRGVSRKGTE